MKTKLRKDTREYHSSCYSLCLPAELADGKANKFLPEVMEHCEAFIAFFAFR